jgi:hypothetical protein
MDSPFAIASSTMAAGKSSAFTFRAILSTFTAFP